MLSAVGRFVDRHPYLALFFLIMGSNGTGSVFNFAYNIPLIVERHLDASQKAAFATTALVYNVTMYPLGLAIIIYLFRPLARCRRMFRAGVEAPVRLMHQARRTLLNLPYYCIFFNISLWLPGAIFFPLSICIFGGMNDYFAIWLHFGISFLVSALITGAQTFFLMEWFLMVVLYPEFFSDVRPADIRGVVRIPFWFRLALLWTAVALMPIVALLAVALTNEDDVVWYIAFGVAVVGIVSGGLISWIVGRDLLHWLRNYGKATEEIRNEHFSARLPQKRPDEWGRLNDRFNDMASGLETGRQVHETLGQFVGVDARGEMLEMLKGLGGEVREITVCFIDIRGFTRRSAGERPERVVELLNEFLTLAVLSVQANAGMVNKFLGDGLMALFGHPPDWRSDHADLAVRAAVDLLHELEKLNERLKQRGEAPLRIGIGIHSGPALVGCIGATFPSTGGRQRARKELTAIGETVNLCQRIEQLTKALKVGVLISGQTRSAMKTTWPMIDHGVQPLERSDERLHIFEVKA